MHRDPITENRGFGGGVLNYPTVRMMLAAKVVVEVVTVFQSIQTKVSTEHASG